MRAVLLLVVTRVLEINLQSIRLVENQLARAPVGAHEVRGIIDAVLVASVGEGGNLREDLDAAGGEAEEAVDGIVVVFTLEVGLEGEGVDGAEVGGGGVVGPVVTGEEGFFVAATGEGAEDVEVGQPAGEEVEDRVGAGNAVGGVAGADDGPCDGKVVLPGDGDAEAGRGDDFEGGEHDCGGKVGVTDFGVGYVGEGVAEVRKYITDPVCYSIGRFGVGQ